MLVSTLSALIAIIYHLRSFPYANCGVCSVASNPIPLEHRLALQRWEQADDGRKLEVDLKDMLPLLLMAEENDPSVTELDLSECNLTDACCRWLHKMMASNRHLRSLKCV